MDMAMLRLLHVCHVKRGKVVARDRIELSTLRFSAALPAPLRELLSDTCGSCGHATVNWAGPIPELEEKIAAAEQTIAAAPGSLAKIRASVAPWLTETVTQ
jgi:hypothetical protein